MTRSNIIDLDVFVVRETDKAVLVQSDEGADGVWLPKSQIEIERSSVPTSPVAVVTLPSWLATEKGLI